MTRNKQPFNVTAIGYTCREYGAIANGSSMARKRLKNELDEIRLLRFSDAVDEGCHALLMSKPMEGANERNAAVLDLTGLDRESASLAVADTICELAYRYEAINLALAPEFDGKGLA